MLDEVVEVDDTTKLIDDLGQCSILVSSISNQIRRPGCLCVTIYYAKTDDTWIFLLIMAS